jgi:hypothetical protein
MRVAGIAVELASPGRPAAHLVVTSDAAGSPAIEALEDFSADVVDVPTQLHDMAEAVKSYLTGAAVDRVVIRRADQTPAASRREGSKLRLLAEGSLTSAAKTVNPDTRIGTGKDTGEWFGVDKAGVDAAAANLLAAGAHHPRFLEATAAAIATLGKP